MNSSKSRLLVQPDFSQPQYITVTPETAGWEHLTFGAVQLEGGKEWSFDTSVNEFALVILGGACDVITNKESFQACRFAQRRVSWLTYSPLLFTKHNNINQSGIR